MVKDLRNTPFAQPVHDFFEHLAQGNEGSATINKLELDGTTLSFDVSIRHRQTTKVHIPFDGDRTIVVYDVTSRCSGSLDLKNPSPNDVNLSIDTPVGPVRFSLSELIGVLLSAGVLN